MPVKDIFGDAASWLVHTVEDAAKLVEGITAHVFLDPTLMPIISLYWLGMEKQAIRKWSPLSAEWLERLTPFYNIDLTTVRYAQGIDTSLSDTAVTIGSHIFFPEALDLSASEDQRWLFHELMHCEQYVRLGGVPDFFHQYIPEIVASVLKARSFNVHDLVPLEAEADARADLVMRSIKLT